MSKHGHHNSSNEVQLNGRDEMGHGEYCHWVDWREDEWLPGVTVKMLLPSLPVRPKIRHRKLFQDLWLHFESLGHFSCYSKALFIGGVF